MAEILAIRPLAVITLGVPAAAALGISPVLLGQQHGKRMWWSAARGDESFSFWLIQLYHPSWALRTGNEALMLADLEAI